MASKNDAAKGDNIGAVRCDRPQNGAEYLESLRDGREVYIYGERVQDVTQHPAFRNTARMTARLFDALHDKERSKKLLLPADTDGKGKTHAFFRAPKTVEESIAGRDAISEWQRITYGWMGRSPPRSGRRSPPSVSRLALAATITPCRSCLRCGRG